MSKQEQHQLDIMTFPLHGTRLIEASAGTGKTYTVAALYVRLVLGHGGEQAFARPLLPPEILVMTFTDAATKELRDRIRLRLTEAAQALTGEISVAKDPFLAALARDYAEDETRQEAIERLQLAAQWMDEAAIYTIHGFSHRLLRQHAFESGNLFDSRLTESAADDNYEAACDYWREFITPLPQGLISSLQQQKVATPEALLQKIKSVLGSRLPAKPFHQIIEGYTQALEAFYAEEAQVREQLVEEFESLMGWFEVAIQEKWVNGRIYTQANLPQKQAQLKAFIEGASCLNNEALRKTLNNFAQPGISFNKAGKERFPGFASATALSALLEHHNALKEFPLKEVLEHAAHWIGHRVENLRLARGTLSFDDMIRRMHGALTGEQGQALAEAIWQRFPVAMVDEFQDTDPLQYEIFSAIYHQERQPQDFGWFMVGDPKQAIYSFRQADIYTYLKARQEADAKYTLPMNYRSATTMVQATNALFLHGENTSEGKGVFAHKDIPFQPVDANGTRTRFVIKGQPQEGLFAWLPEAFDTSQSQGAYQQEQAQHTANYIAELLRLAQQHHAGFEDDNGQLRPLRPNEVAILVRNKKQAHLMRQALAAKAVASVFFSEQNSVFHTQEAHDFYLILEACAHPEDSRKVRNALACESMAQPLDELVALLGEEEHNSMQQEQAWEATLEQFQAYRDAWRSKGVLAMMEILLQDYQVPQRLARQQQERALVNLRHLAELAQEAATQLEGEQALLRWFRNEMLAEEDADQGNSQLRLESDAERVHILTIHKSKGLEFPLVFLPFICGFRPMQAGEGGRYPVDGELYEDLVLSKEAAEQAEEERLAEDMRLLYVAITRAVHGCWLGLAPVRYGNAKSNQVHLSAMGRLLFGKAIAEADVLPALAATSEFISFLPLPEEAEPLALTQAQPELQPPLIATFVPESPSWWIGNYSALKTARPYVPNQASSVDDEEHDLVEDIQAAEGIHAFPGGTEVGNLWHRLLEDSAEVGFAAQLQQLKEQPKRFTAWLEARLGSYGWESHAQTLYEQWQRWLKVPLLLGENGQVALAELRTYVAEMEFWFPSQPFSTEELEKLLRRHLMPSLAAEEQRRPPFLANQLNGMFKGYIDLVFEHQGRYYVLDYKSNLLGSNAQAYHASNLEDAILKYRYEAQYTFYLLALHKLLKARLGSSYNPEQHLGGAVYLFLRGTEHPETHGCYFHRPPQALIDALDQRFTLAARGNSHE